MLTIIVFLLILGVLVFVHELGHFMVARRNGITAHEFGFGFPPRFFGIYKKNGKYRIVFGNKDVEADNTVYSVNFIPLGGFVKIKGEDGSDASQKDSFAGKSAWVRVQVLAAGVIMNFILGWLLISVVLMIGAPEAKTEGGGGGKIQIAEVMADSPAEKIGVKMGDQIVGCATESQTCQNNFKSIEEIQNYINANKGSEIALKIKRGDLDLVVKGVPRVDYPATQGPLGISLVETVIAKYPIHIALWKGLIGMFNMIYMIFSALFTLLSSLIIGKKAAMDVAGPVGIAYLTKQVTSLGLVYVLNFAAVLSINLGIINALPIPALDGGRILFVIIEKLKGKPVSQKIEQMFHTVGFVLLITLMVVVTFRDLIKFDIFYKIKNLFL